MMPAIFLVDSLRIHKNYPILRENSIGEEFREKSSYQLLTELEELLENQNFGSGHPRRRESSLANWKSR